MVGNALATSATVVLTMGLGGVLAILIVVEFGKDARTDGLLAAYGVYGLLLAFAQSLRATVVARLVEGPSLFENLDRFVAATLVVVGLAAIPLVLAGPALAELLTGDLPTEAGETARTALAWFWLAAGTHLVAALVAAALGVRGEFGPPGLAYVAGGVLSIAFLVTFDGSLGIDAVSVGITLGALVTAGLMLWRAVRRGYRLRPAQLLPRRRRLVDARVMFLGSVGYMIPQATYVISVAFAARIEEGAVTLYSYAFFAAMLVIGASSGAAGIVLAAPLSQTWDRRPETLEPDLVKVTRAGLLLIIPLLGVAALVGDDLVELVLGGSLGSDDPAVIADSFLALAGVMISSAALPVPMLAAFATGRYGGVAVVSIVTVAVHVPLSALGLAVGTPEAIAGAASLSATVSLVLMLAVVHGRAIARPLVVVLAELARLAAIGGAAFLPGLALGAVGGRTADVAGALVGLAAYALLLRAMLPGTWQLVRLARRQGASRAAQRP
jgi:peptidoglycan biosynthesis protein MviN/MurJ (putative lipid II flippase)